MLVCSLLLDVAVQPRRVRGWRWQGLLIHILVLASLFGVLLTGSGSFLVASLLATALMALLVVTSNAKHAMLGEPLLFSDLALLIWIFRHPRFYLTAISRLQRWILVGATLALIVILAALFVPRLAPHLLGLGLFVASVGMLHILIGSRAVDMLAREPDADADRTRLGLIATLLLYWLRWRATPDPAPYPFDLGNLPDRGDTPTSLTPELIVIVQCESFADPVDLTGEARHALPGLARARASAWKWGGLCVSGFGAYTMRTEYGVLFGRSESALGFRRYDPFLTAHGETSYALSARLGAAGYQSLFVHPHDMRFYGRDKLMPAIGFNQVIGEDSFAPIAPDSGRYVDDQTLGKALGKLIDSAQGPTLIYAVTMENHGPWIKDQSTDSPGGLDAYLRHVGNSDAMLESLIARLANAKKPALLVFFGDHRPSIPGVTAPGGARHTPYVMHLFSDDGQIEAGLSQPADLTPDALHHVIVRCALGELDNTTASRASGEANRQMG